MKLMILGASYGQLNAIRRAREEGIEVICTDYNKYPIGKKYATLHKQISTFDYENNLKLAIEEKIDGVMTTGTDQPVYIVNKIANELGLPAFLENQDAQAVTNKYYMKNRLIENDIPCTNYAFLTKDFNETSISHLEPPFVIKPIDSQGQRGVFKVDSINEIRDLFDEVLSYSRENKILCESYYSSNEITVSAYVKDNNMTILTITDRMIFSEGNHIGICYAHRFPSYIGKADYFEAVSISEKIKNAFKIKNGPVYIQLLCGKEGVRVNEVAARIGGAYEDVFIPFLTGFDIQLNVIYQSLGIKNTNLETSLKTINPNKGKYLLCLLFYLKSGTISNIIGENEVESLKGNLYFSFFYKEGDSIQAIDNATKRAGVAIFYGESKEKLNRNIDAFYNCFKVKDIKGNDMIIKMDENEEYV